MKRTALLCMFTAAMMLAACQQSPSQMMAGQTDSPSGTLAPSGGSAAAAASRTPETGKATQSPQSPVVTHVRETVEGKVIKLNIDADVTQYPGKELGIYDAKPLQVDQEAWYDYFFSGIDRNELTHYYANWGQKYRDLQGITDEVVRNTFAYIYGDIHDPTLQAGYLIQTASFMYQNGITDLSMEDECTLTADESERAEAEALSDAFMGFAAGGRLTRTSCEIARRQASETGVYISHYARTIDGFPIVVDAPFLGGDAPDALDSLQIDGGDVWVSDGEVLYANAVIRDIELRESRPVISLDQALRTLALYADTVQAYSEDYASGKSEVSEFDVNRIELMYYPVLMEDSQLAQTYAGRHAYVTYRPVWCVSSGERHNTNFVFVMIIDAVTGEVIG